MNKIIVNRGSFKLEEFDFTKNSLTIGRAPDNDIKLDDIAVSNHHAKIVKVLNTCYIQDLGSTNGTLVNGKKMYKRSLYSGDIISLGKHQLLYQSDISTPSSADDNTMVLHQTDIEKSLKEYMNSNGNGHANGTAAQAKAQVKPTAAPPRAAAAAQPAQEAAVTPPQVAPEPIPQPQPQTAAAATPQRREVDRQNLKPTPAPNPQAVSPVANPATKQAEPVIQEPVVQKPVEQRVEQAPATAATIKPSPATQTPVQAEVETQVPQDYLQHLQAAAETIAKHHEPPANTEPANSATNSEETAQADEAMAKPQKQSVPDTRLILGRRPKAKDKPVIQVDPERPKPPPYNIATHKIGENPDTSPEVVATSDATRKRTSDSGIMIDDSIAATAPKKADEDPKKPVDNYPGNPAFHGAQNIAFTSPKPRKGMLSALWALIIVALIVEVIYITYRALN